MATTMISYQSRFRARTRPHPILKGELYPAPLADDLPFTTCDYILSPHVHFPPTPDMTSLRFTHSPTTYDRAPIVVSPNECLLLKRAQRKLHSPPANFDEEQRGRSRSRSSSRERDDDDDEAEDVKGSYFHPRAYEACAPEPLNGPGSAFDIPTMPILVSDFSPSEESDDSVDTPPDPSASALVAASMTIPPDAAFRAPLSASKCDARPGTRRRSQAPTSKRLQEEPDEGATRPFLKRGVAVVKFAPDLDEGCLGGF